MSEPTEPSPQFGSILSKWKQKDDRPNDLRTGAKSKLSVPTNRPDPEQSCRPSRDTNRKFNDSSPRREHHDGHFEVSRVKKIDFQSHDPNESSSDHGHKVVEDTDNAESSCERFWGNKSGKGTSPAIKQCDDRRSMDCISKGELQNSPNVDSYVSPKPSEVRRRFDLATANNAIPTMFAHGGLGVKVVSSATAPIAAKATSTPSYRSENLISSNASPVKSNAPIDERGATASPKTDRSECAAKIESADTPLSSTKLDPKLTTDSPEDCLRSITDSKQTTSTSLEISPLVEKSPLTTPVGLVLKSGLSKRHDSNNRSVVSALPALISIVDDTSVGQAVPSPKQNRRQSIRMTTRMSFRNIYQKPLDDTPNFKPPVHERYEHDMVLIRNALAKIFVFSSLTDHEMEEMCKAFEECSFKAGDTIVKASNPDGYFYIVKEGEVNLAMDGKNPSKADVGDYFGEMSLVMAFACHSPAQKSLATATANAITDVTLYRVDQTTVRQTLRSQQTRSEDDRLNLLHGVRFLQDLCEADLKKLASVMTPVPFAKDELIVEKGMTSENSFYIIKEGSVICKDVTAGQTEYSDQQLGPGEWFGEGSLISNETRQMNVIAQSRGMLYSIDRKTFDSVVGKFKDLVLKAQDSQRLAGLRCLKNANLNGRQLACLASVIVEKKYMTMQLILAQYLKTKIAIYFVRKGEVEISSRGKVEIVKAGGYFGDSAFKDDGTFDASIYWKPPFSAKALSPVVCGILTLQDARTVFDTALLADQSAMSESFNMSFARIDTDADLEDLVKHSILGEGTFGQVWLVSEPLPELQEARPFALKIQSKCELAREGQIKAVMEEKKILAKIQHPFTCKLIKAFQDSLFVYLLMEYVQGGELFSLLHSDDHHERGFPEEQAKFYSFCLADVFAYIHRSKIVFRDLKPENIMIDHLGYPILIDFGFAKYVPDKTYTLCGTPGYLPPEVVTTRGHDCSADHWSFGILIHEMVTGTNPFYSEGMDQISLFHSIVMDPVECPTNCSTEAADLIMRLLVKDPTRRLGSLARGEREIKEHPWFKGLDLNEFRRRRVTAPWVPKLRDAFDTSCFDDWSHLPDITTQEFGEISDQEKTMFRGFEDIWD